MIFNKFATRLNSFTSMPELFLPNKSNFNVTDLINRAAKVKGLTHIDLNYPDHVEENLKDMKASKPHFCTLPYL